jgi:hypothetical protein
MNFNFNSQPEYKLNTSLAEEMIRLYGVLTKFLVTEKINTDDNVFGDYSHLKSDNSKIYDIHMLPENSEEWDSEGFSLTSFGLVNYENISLFVAKSSFDGIAEPGDITGNLVVFPNNKVMEITNANFVTPGVNNLFTYSDAKSVYKITCKPYDFKLIDEIDNSDISIDPEVPYDTLDNYFQEMVTNAERQEFESEIKPQVTVVENKLLDEKKLKPIIDKTEQSVWGEFD